MAKLPLGKTKLRPNKLALWLKHYLNESCSTTFLNKTESARKAGYNCRTKNKEDCFRSIGGENFGKLSDKIEIWLDSNSLSENALKIKLLSLMNAQETKFFAHEGRVTDEREIPAIETQRKTLDMALKVKGMNAPEKHEVTGKDGKPIVPHETIIKVEYCEKKPSL